MNNIELNLYYDLSYKIELAILPNKIYISRGGGVTFNKKTILISNISFYNSFIGIWINKKY